MASYYVNPSAGSDTNPGTEAGPFATIGKALTEAVPGDTIYLARGYKYPALYVNGKDGTAGSPYTWDAYGIGTDPIISAFMDPSGSWSDQGSNIWAYQNAALDQVNILATSGANQPIGRWPKRAVAEYYAIDSASGNTSITDNTNLAAAPNFVGGELVSKKRKWTIDRSPITGQTSSTLTVTGSDVNYKAGNGYFVQNHINCLTEQGDWCYDAATDTVYFYSTSDPNALDIDISFDEHALHVDGSDYHAFHNLIFEGGWGHNIYLDFSHNVSFTGCVSRLAGMNGLQTYVSENASWVDSYMYDVNNNGINNRDASQGLTVMGSSFVRIASIPGMGQGGSNQQNGIHINNTEHNALIDGNFFFQIGNCGVYYRGNNCYVGHNYAERCGWTVSDAAAFYSFGNYSSPYTNIICEYNIAFDCIGNIDGIGGTPQYDTCGFYTDDNCQNVTVRFNYAEKCGYCYYIHNNQNVSYHNNIGIDGGKILYISDDNVQGVGSTLRVRNISVQDNIFKALAGQKLIAARTIGDFSADDPFLYGVINNNQMDAVDANPFNVHLTNNYDTDFNLADWRGTYLFDINSTTDPYNDAETIFFANDTEEAKVFFLDGIYEDWDQLQYSSGEVTLDPNSSILLFRISDFPGPGFPVGKYPGIRFVTLQDRYGQAVYDTYVRAKANDATLGASLMDIKPIADKVLAHSWDMLNVPVAYKDNALYSLIGPDLVVSGGGNGSRFDRNGLLVTELPNDRPRFTFDPEDIGKFEGVFLEIDDTNKLPNSNDFLPENDYVALSNNQIELSNINSPENLLNAYRLYNSEARWYPNIATEGTIKSIFVRSVSGEGNIQTLNYNTYPDGKFIINEKWKRVKAIHIAGRTGESHIYVVDFRGGDTLTEALFFGAQVSSHDTSYIKTTGSQVTRPADTLQATGLINTASPYSLFEIRNGQGILRYVDPGAGMVRTYTDGVYIGEEAFTPSADLILNSQGSDKLLASGYYSGSLTEQERLTRSALLL